MATPSLPPRDKAQVFPWISNENFACCMFFVSQTIWVFSFIYPNQHNFSPFETNLLRGGCVVPSTLIICYYYGYDVDFRPSLCSMKSLVIRNVIMTLQGISCAFVQFYLPLPVVHTIGCSGAIFVCIVDYLRYEVSLSWEQKKGVAVGFLGILLVINNKLLSGADDSSSQFSNYKTTNVWVITLVAMLFAIMTMIWAYGVIETKVLRNLNTFQINFHFGICTLLASALLYPLDKPAATPRQMATGIFTTGIPMTVGQFLFIGALSITEKHGKVSIMMFAQVIMGYILSIFRYKESVNLVAVLGTLLACFGVLKCLMNKG